MKIKHASLKRNPNTTWYVNNQIELAAFFPLVEAKQRLIWRGELGIDSSKATDLDNSSQPIPTELQAFNKRFSKVCQSQYLWDLDEQIPRKLSRVASWKINLLHSFKQIPHIHHSCESLKVHCETISIQPLI